jgi:ferritin
MSTKYLKLQIRSKNSQNYVSSLVYSVVSAWDSEVQLKGKATCIRVQCVDNSFILLTVSMFKHLTYTDS